MPKIEIDRPHQLSIEDARTAVDKVASRMHEKFSLNSQWQGNTLQFLRPGLNGTIVVNSATIQVKAELGMMYSPLKGMIEQEIRRKLDELFA